MSGRSATVLREAWSIRLRWMLERWPRRPEMDAPHDPGASAWRRFRRSGGASGRIHDAFRRRLTPSGKALCGLWFVSLVVSRFAIGSLADLPFALFSAALVVSWILSWRPVRPTGIWRVPQDVEVGSTGEAEVVLDNPHGRAVHDVGAGFFRFADGLEFPGDGRHHPALPPGGRLVLRIPVLGRLRGPANVDPPHLLVAEPLGLMRSSVRLEGSARIVVKPTRPHLTSFRFLVSGVEGAGFARELGAASTRQGDPSGVREYREGDSLRDLHHRSWARRGKPVTRERTAARGDGIRLAVSTWCPRPGDRPLVDGLLGFAAGVARWLERNGALGDAWIDGVRIEPGSAGLAEHFWFRCGELPRTGWSRRTEETPPLPPPLDTRPLLVLALGRNPFGEQEAARTKRILLDWSATSERVEGQGRLLRLPPARLDAAELSL